MLSFALLTFAAVGNAAAAACGEGAAWGCEPDLQTAIGTTSFEQTVTGAPVRSQIPTAPRNES